MPSERVVTDLKVTGSHHVLSPLGLLAVFPFFCACLDDVHRSPWIDALIFFILKMEKLRFTEVERLVKVPQMGAA